MSDFIVRTPKIFEPFTELVAGYTKSTELLPEVDAYYHANFGMSTIRARLSGEQLQAEEARVLQRRQELCEQLLGPGSAITCATQIHGTNIIEAPKKGDPEGSQRADGIVSTQHGNLLCGFAADCAIALLYDPIAKVIATAHSGWRGTEQNIMAHTVQRMREHGAQPERMLVYLAPSICGKHYEVGEEFTQKFDAKFFTRHDGKLFFDNAAAIVQQLQDSGITQLEVDPICTYEDMSLHSHRRDHLGAGRLVAFIGLKHNA